MAALVNSLVSFASRGLQPLVQKNTLINFVKPNKLKLVQEAENKGLPKSLRAPQNNRNSSSKLFCKEDVKVQKLLPSYLRSFKTTIANNAAKLTNQLNSARGIPKRNFLHKDYLIRRARYGGYLFSFGGLAFMQDELYQEVEEQNLHFGNYMSLCSSLKRFFTFDGAFTNKEVTKIDWNNYVIGEKICTKQNSTVYEFNEETLDESTEEAFTFVDDISSEQSFEVIPEPTELATEDNWGDFYEQKKDIPKAEFTVEVLKNTNKDLVLPLKNQTFDEYVSYGNFNTGCIASCVGYHPNLVMVEHIYEDNKNKTKEIVQLNISNGMEFLFRFEPNITYLHLVTNRYDQTLKSYMEEYKMDEETIMVLIMQLLEAVSFLKTNFTVHRKITPETIYLDTSIGGYPRLLLGDFCDAFQATSEVELMVPFEHISFDTRVPFNMCQAPEIFSATPGNGKYVDYRNSDVWSVGIIASVLFNKNLLRFDSGNNSSRSREDLCRFSSLFLASLLNPNPQLRLKPDEAANLIHLRLFANFNSEDFLNYHQDNIYNKLAEWLTMHFADFALRRRRDDVVLHDSCASFFRRLDFKCLAFSAVLWGEFSSH